MIPYDEARPHIADGDLIVLRSPWWHSPLAAATRLLLWTPYTHTSVALWLEGRLWVAEMWRDGNCLVPLSQYRDTPFDVFACPAEGAVVKAVLLEDLGAEIDYDWRDLARIAAHRLVGWPLPAHEDERLVCSAWSARAYLAAGWRPEGLHSLVAPDDLAAALGGAPRLRVRPFSDD